MNQINSSIRINVLAILALFLFLGIEEVWATSPSLLLNFGGSVTATTATNSAAHAAGATPLSQISWNTGLTAPVSSGLVYSDGSAASGVSFTIGASTGGASSNVVTYGISNYKTSALGADYNTGIYAANCPARGGLFTSTGGSYTNIAIALRVDGLPAGPYTIFCTGRNSSYATSQTPEEFYAFAGATGNSFTFSTAADASALEANSIGGLLDTTNYAAGNNYCVASVTLSAGQSLYLASLGAYYTTPGISGGTGEARGFIDSVEIVPAGAAPQIAGISPASQTVLQGMYAVNFSASVEGGTPPIFYQWLFNGTNILGATNGSTLTLTNVTLAMAGNYSLSVSNAFGKTNSANSVLTVTPTLRTGELTNIWTLLPGAAPYVTTGTTERGLAFDAFTANLILVSRALGEDSNNLVVLNPQTGALVDYMQVSGIPADVAGTSLGLNVVGVGDDGVVYAASVTASAATTSFNLYQWADDTTNSTPTAVFSGDPGSGVAPNLRWGDNMAVRGAGANTQVLLAPGSGTNVVLLQTPDGVDFQYAIPPVVIAVSNVPSAFAQLGLAFGPGTNTFWAKTYNNQLYLVQFDLAAGTGTVIATFSLPANIGVIGANNTLNQVAGLAITSDDNVQLFNVANLAQNAAPLLDEYLFPVKNGNGPEGGTGCLAFGSAGATNFLFALDTENGIMAFQINTNVAVPAQVTQQPASQTLLEYYVSATFTAGYAGTAPVYFQWFFDDAPISGATNLTLTVSNLTAGTAGDYSLSVSNAYGSALSSNAILTLVPVLDTDATTNIWTQLAGSEPYLGTGSTERSLAYDAAATNLLLVSRLGGNDNIVVLDPQTGAFLYDMDVNGISGDIPNLSLGLNTVGVASDGTVYAGSVTVAASSDSFDLYQWADDTTNSAPTLVFSGDPAGPVAPDLRWGDNLAVRGAGANTQVLLAPSTGTNVVLLQTSDGVDFQYAIPPVVIAVSNVPSGFAELGLAFGPGTNTFWAKNVGRDLYLIQFDPVAGVGTILYDFPSNYVSSAVRGISTDSQQRWLAGIATNSPDNVQFFDISHLATTGPVLLDQKLFTTENSTFQGSVGYIASTSIGGNYIFALDGNNGIQALRINLSAMPLSPFSITTTSGQAGAVVLSWPSAPGHTYQVQSTASLSSGWTNYGAPIMTTNSSISVTNISSGGVQFFRVMGQ